MKRFFLTLAFLLVFVTTGFAQTITTTACPGDGCMDMNVGGQGSIGIQITGTWVGTITFQGSVNNSTFVSLLVTPSNSTTAVTTTTANGVWTAPIAGLTTVRVVFTAFTSGTASVTRRTTSQARASGGGSGGVPGAAVWGLITGTLSDQTDLQSALDAKAPLASPTFTGNVGIEAAGVRLTAADGVLTLLGLGNGNDENLIIDLDNASANTVKFYSSTSADQFTFAPNSSTQDALHFRISDGSFTQILGYNAAETSYYQLRADPSTARILVSTDEEDTYGEIRATDTSITLTLNGVAGFAQLGTNTTTSFINLPPAGSNIDLASAGVRFTATDGVLTLLGRGNGNDEDLTWDFDNATTNTVAVGTGTGVVAVSFGAIALRPGANTFGNLATYAVDGTLLYCSDCTIANPCAGSGTGAFAKRLNGVWVCN